MATRNLGTAMTTPHSTWELGQGREGFAEDGTFDLPDARRDPPKPSFDSHHSIFSNCRDQTYNEQQVEQNAKWPSNIALKITQCASTRQDNDIVTLHD
jgi:hypothetical protein